jgi:CHAT domain-containing protein
MAGAATPTRPWAVFAYLCGDNPKLASHVAKQKEALLRFAGSDHFHVAAQWDLPEGAERAVQTASREWKTEKLGRLNTGDPARFLEFLRWGFDRCPAEKAIVILSGTGLLDARASVGTPDTDRTRLFTVCDDSTSGDALSLSEVGPMFRQAVATATRDRIDILALDLRELQCLEVAYELEGMVDYLIAPQTRVPDSGWNFEVVFGQLDATLDGADRANPPDSAAIAKLLVETIGKAYERERHGHLSLSALDLHTLKNFASAFDTLSLAMMHSVGDELVWEARVAVARKLKPGDPTTSIRGTATPSTPAAGGEVNNETEYLYDLFEMLAELRTQLSEAGRSGLFRLVREHLEPLDVTAFKRALESIDAVCVPRGNRAPLPSLRDPAAARRRLRALLDTPAPHAAPWFVDRAKKTAQLSDLFTDPTLTAEGFQSWLDAWPDDAVAVLEPALRATYRIAQRQQQRLEQLAKMTDRVLALLRGSPGKTTAVQTRPLVIAHFASPSEARHGGVSLYRPRDLDQLIASDYLKLRFNQKIHWTVLLAVINLIGSHPRALWRILSALLATADNNTRAQIIDRITGPGSVIAPFRDQFVVLAPVKAYVLSLEPDTATAFAAPATTSAVTATAGRARAYRIRLELAERGAFIHELRSMVDPDTLESIVTGLVTLLKPGTPLTPEDAKRIESLGETLGEDILQELGVNLSEASQSSRQIHLQLQIPRDLMKYPWELMHFKNGWLSEHFAMARQVFSGLSSGIMRSRVPGPLRALVIGNPKTTTTSLVYAAQEAQEIANTFEALAAETDGLLDFKRDRDAFINQRVTHEQLRELLRHGNYDIIHFAGHAVFEPGNPGESGWLLSDGRLTARAIRNTLAWRDSQPWLVYANACEAATEADGTPAMYQNQNEVYGLASAFLDHGASVFIGPLWRINDNVAARVARSFYQHMLKERQTVGEALRLAKVEAKAETFDRLTSDGGSTDRVEHISWAGLVVYGNSTATFGQRLGAPPPRDPGLDSPAQAS